MKNKNEDQFQGCYHSGFFTTGGISDAVQETPS